ncbi:zinc-ribbon domain-containing protein [Pseudotabrizicola sp.]|uniref:zinc-ribbon domain-containing protein n=1 Tax=Pseudotabrizicola sp. TaxID=2939647 RepID=UPI003522A633
MKLFQCQCCGQILYFENTVCLRCGNVLGYLPDEDRMLAVQAEGPVWRALPDLQVGRRESPDPGPLRFCRNWERSACNWMQASDGVGQAGFCLACQHNRTVSTSYRRAHGAAGVSSGCAAQALHLRLSEPDPLQPPLGG